MGKLRLGRARTWWGQDPHLIPGWVSHHNAKTMGREDPEPGRIPRCTPCRSPPPQPHTTWAPRSLVVIALGAEALQAPSTQTSSENPMEVARWEELETASRWDWELGVWERHSCHRGGLSGSPQLGPRAQAWGQAAAAGSGSSSAAHRLGEPGPPHAHS